MRLSSFLRQDVEHILVEWELVARTMIPPAETMSVAALRDHAPRILLALAKDIEAPQTERERLERSRGGVPRSETAAAAHGALRQHVGFNLAQLAGEYRAIRATVLRMWFAAGGLAEAGAVEQVMRFNEAVDAALAESITSYSAAVASSRDVFLAVLGHDLRTPMAALFNCVELLRTLTASEHRGDTVAAIAMRSLSSMNELITDLLDYTRVRLGDGIELNRQKADVGAVCAAAIDEIQVAQPRHFSQPSIARGLTATIDAARLRQVLINLLSNAIQHGDASSPVSLTARREGEEIAIEVKNGGVPIPPHLMQVIFNPLVQIPAVKTQPHERPMTSLGLGLFISREIVIAHGGKLSVSSSEQDGTTFRFTLPAAPALTGR